MTPLKDCNPGHGYNNRIVLILEPGYHYAIKTVKTQLFNFPTRHDSFTKNKNLIDPYLADP